MSNTNEESHPIFSTIVVLSMVPNIILRGWVSKVLWAWFLVPMGLPPANLVQVLGISLSLGYLTGTTSIRSVTSPDSDDEFSEKVGKWALGWILPLLVLGIAWIYTKFL